MALKRSFEKEIDGEGMHIEFTANVTVIDSIRVLGLSSEDADFFTSYPDELRTKVFRKVRNF